MKKSLSLILALALVFTMFASVVSADDTTAATPTTVTAATYTPQQAFDFLKEAGIVEGDSVKGANLDGNLTRAEFSKVIAKLWGLEENAAGSTVYSDLSGAGWAAGYIGAATKAGLLNGVGGGKFNPSGNVKLEEIAKVVATGFKLPSVDYKGTGKVSSWAKGYVGAVIGAKLVDDSADFTKAAKRSEIFTIGYAGYKAIEDAKQPTPTPVPASKALDIASAVALNSKVVEVTLATAAVAADLAATGAVTAKDAAGAALVVSSVTAAPYNTDGKVVLVTLAADTTVGSLYTLTSGTKSVNFGGQPVDTTAPTVSSIAVNDYNEIEITFSEPVQIPGAVITAAQSYGTKAALATSAFTYDGNNKIKVTTDAQLASTLYSLSISGVKDWAGNTIVTDNAQTFVGVAKPTDANTLSTVTPITPWDSKTIKVTYALKVDATTSLDKSKYSVALTYGDKTAIAVTAVALDTVDTTGRTVVLTLDKDTVSSLYTVTVAAGVTTKYGVATTAALTGTFVGVIADIVALPVPTAVSTSNTTLTLTFGNTASKVADSVLATTTKDQFAITEAYGTKAALEIKSISITDNVVTLTTGPQSGVLYNVVVKTGIKDIKGNATTADLTTTLVGSVIAPAITSITSAVLTNTAGTELTVVFGGNVGASATDISHYTINNSVGYPSKAVKDSANTVKLTVPATSANKLYVLTVKGLENADGVAMDAAGITKSFTGKGLTTKNPTIQAIIATDKQTLNIYFDRDVTDSTIKGKIWNNNALVAGSLALKTVSTVYGGSKDLDTYANNYVYQDSKNLNVLVVRIPTADFKSDNKRADGTLAIVAADGLLATNGVVTPFSPSATDIAAISIQNIMATSSNSIRVYFNQAVEIGNLNFATIGTSATTPGAFTLTKAVAIDTTNTIYDFKLNGTLPTATSFWLIANTGVSKADIHDYTANNNPGFVTLLDQDTVAANTQNVTQFAGTITPAGYITSAQVVAPNKKSLVIYFPEAMNAVSITGGSTDALDPHNYTLVDSNNAAIGTNFIANNVVKSAYDLATNSVTFTLKAELPTSANGHYIKLENTLENAIGNKTVRYSATDAVTVAKFQLAPSSVAAPLVTVTSATYTNAAGVTKVTIVLNQALTSVNAAALTNTTTFDTYFALTVNSGTPVANAKVIAVDSTTTAGTIVVTLDPSVVVNAGGVGTVTAKANLVGLNGEAGDATSSASFSH